jgi:hypothetical protein
MIPSHLSSTPKSSPTDKAHALVRGLVSSTPLVGGFAAAIFNLLIVPPFQKRLESWMNMVAADLDELRSSGLISLEALSNDERFVTTMIQCTQVAIRHHQQEKMNLLRNIVFNTAQQKYAKNDFESIFIKYIDELTPNHFTLLSFIWSEEFNLQRVKSYEEILNYFFNTKNISVDLEIFELLCDDLNFRYLVRFSQEIQRFDNGLYSKKATVIGRYKIDQDQNLPMLKVTELGRSILDLIKRS